MFIFKHYNLNKLNILNAFIAILPLSIIIGSLAININTLLIIILGFIIYKKKIFFLEKKIFQYLIYLFFFLLIFTTAINNIPNFGTHPLYEENFYKSIFFTRFLLLFLVINRLIEEKTLNIKLFFISCSFFSFLLAIDIIIQVIFGKNLIGHPITLFRPAGFFGSEHIAGSYLQKFIFFFIFLVYLKYQNSKYLRVIAFLLFLLLFIPIVLTGNRMPAVIYLTSCLVFFLLVKNFKEILSLVIFSSLIIFLIFKYPVIDRIDKRIGNYYLEVKNILFYSHKIFFQKNEVTNVEGINLQNNYLLHFNTGIQIWKKNKIIGNGIKSMWLKCEFEKKYQLCNTHPHNYFIQLLMETGVVGLTLIYLIFTLSLFNFLKFFYSVKDKIKKIITMPFFLIVFFEFFPLRSTGSFFTTNVAVIIFLIFPFFINCEKINFLKSFYKR